MGYLGKMQSQSESSPSTGELINSFNDSFPSAIVALISTILIASIFAFFYLYDRKTLNGSIFSSSDSRGTNDIKTRLTLEDRRDLAVKEIEALSMQRGLYELDPSFCIDNPSFLDLTADHMIDLSLAQKKTKRVMNQIVFIPLDNLTENDVEMLEDAADDLSHALEAAVDTSKAIGWGKISREEKKLLSRAQDLLSMALNEASTDNERMLSLRKLEDTIIEVRETYGYSINVEKIMLAVEEQTRMMIAA